MMWRFWQFLAALTIGDVLQCTNAFVVQKARLDVNIPPCQEDDLSTISYRSRHPRNRQAFRRTAMVKREDDNEKFGMSQRINSGKTLVLGAVVGALAQGPASFLRDVILSGSLAQWEFDTDAAALSAGLFAIVYRYCIRQDDNPQLNQGVIGAFVMARTLARVSIPSYCTAIPLYCGPPLSYLDWNLLQQLLLSGVESALLFGFTALAVDIAMEKGYISKFPG